jgi:hypothetical protein
MKCAMLSRPPFHAFLPSGPPRKHVSRERSHAFAELSLDVVSEPARESMAHPRRRPGCPEGRPGFVAMVEFVLAARRRTTPMRVRPTDPCRAPCRPYGLGRHRGAACDQTPFPFARSVVMVHYSLEEPGFCGGSGSRTRLATAASTSGSTLKNPPVEPMSRVV